jgi:hypothetical protein
MIEDGKEYFGYGFMSDRSDQNEVERQFMENIQYLEYHCRELGLDKRGMTLATKISALFDRLPPDCENTITDHREGMIKEVVRFRNRTAHGDYDSPRPASKRLLALSIKIASLLTLNDALDDSGPQAASELSKKASPFLRSMLGLSDRPNSAGAPGVRN